MHVLEKGQKLPLPPNLLNSDFTLSFNVSENTSLVCMTFTNNKLKDCIADIYSSISGVKDISSKRKEYLINLPLVNHDIDEIIFFAYSDKLEGLFNSEIKNNFIVQTKFEGEKYFSSIRLYKHNGLWKLNYKGESNNENFESYLQSNFNYKIQKINKPKDSVEIKNKLINLAQKIIRTKDQIQSEEATKTAYILPFLQILGYDIFNPIEVQPEPVADIGTKKGEKVDYGIYLNNKQEMIIECKSLRENLDIHKSQLHRYFNVSQARIACLTNGMNYRFYSDIEELNKIDFEPFLEFNILDISDNDISSISIFSRKNFDFNNIISFAKQVKKLRETEYINKIKGTIIEEFSNPSPDFVRFLLNYFYDKEKVTSKTIEYFTPIVKKGLDELQD